jgi:hypothetical protein
LALETIYGFKMILVAPCLVQARLEDRVSQRTPIPSSL